MGFLDDLVDLAKSVGEASNELKGLKKDVLSTITDVKAEAKKMIDPTNVGKPSEEVEESAQKPKPKAKTSDTE